MPMCRVCGEDMPDGTRTCRECGSALPDLSGSAPRARSSPPKKARKTAPPEPKKLPPGGRFCPGCGSVYDADYTDAFCICGAELEGDAPPVADAVPPMAAVVAPPAVSPPVPREVVEVGWVEGSEPAPSPRADLGPRGERPTPGTRCLVLYGSDRQPKHYFPLTKDATLIGRLDAAAGNFPDIDVDEWLDAATARRISRQHALVLRSRVSGDFTLRPLPGNTGTQVESEMLLPMHDHTLLNGERLILGGAVRFKVEVA